jgi:hypothetical protein
VATDLDRPIGTAPGDIISQQRGDGSTPHAVTPWTRRAGLITCLGVGAMVGVMLIAGVFRAQNRPDRFTAAQTNLAKSLEELPFTARLPQPVPAGARLVSVIVQEPDEDRGPSIYAMETTYTVVGDQEQADRASARYVRVWQTNDVYIRKTALDPLGQRINPVELDGNTWYRRDGLSLDRAAGVSYSTRFDDGITAVVSGPDEQMVLDTIAALRQG